MRPRSEKPVTFARRTRKESSLGITLTELVIIVGIVAMLAGLGIPAYNKYRDNARMVQAVADIRTMEHDIYIYEGYNAKLPDFLDRSARATCGIPGAIPTVPERHAEEGKAVRRFDKLSNPLNADFDLYSMGKDGKTKQISIRRKALTIL